MGGGPTIDDMRALVAELTDQVPAIDISDLRYSRGNTDLGEAVALLHYLDTHPEDAAHVDTFTVAEAFEGISWRNTPTNVWLRRGRAQLSLNPHGGGVRGTRLLEALGKRGSHGWDAVLDWLDAIAAADEDPDVVSLVERRCPETAHLGWDDEQGPSR